MSLGLVFHCTNNSNWESIRKDGLLLSKTRGGQARSRQAIHFVHACGETGPAAGTMILYGKDIFYCQIDYWKFYQAGHKLYLTGNGAVLSYVDPQAPAAAVRKADIFIRDPQGQPLREADRLIRHQALALRRSQDADLCMTHLATRTRVHGRKVEARACPLHHLSPKLSTPQTSESPLMIDEVEKQQTHRRVEAVGRSAREHCQGARGAVRDSAAQDKQ